MTEPSDHELRQAESLLRLRQSQVDDLEARIQGSRAVAEEKVRACEDNLRTGLAELWSDPSLYRKAPTGLQVLDRSRRREIGRRRDRSLDLIDREFRRLERELPAR